ncbi:MAG: MdtA/MuxA family multidrug efflux RND transporter periplasmic adaptor subunit, partial [Pseudomonadota bacterium]|nr:MdtA/MuxA family multidrug efflux RND transporter periplasmic adaptor subunit [Pseudomonadota bacterium]
MNRNVDPARMREVQPARPLETPEANPPRRRRGRRLIGVIVLAALAIVAFERLEKLAPGTVESKKAEPAGPPPQTIRAATAERGQMPITLDALGTVTPLATVTIRTQISGKLMSVGFTEGQLVKAGDFLAQIDSRPFEAALAQAQGQLAKDASLLQQAQANLARYQTLNRQDSIAKQQVDDQAFLVAQDKAAIATDTAQIDTAKLNIAYTRITSPITGRVGLRLVDPGNYVQPSDANGLVVVTQLDPISVVFTTAEDNLPRISARLAAGAKLPATAFDRANVKALEVGELTTFDNQIDTSTGTFKLRATFANPDNALFPNQFVNVRLLVDTLNDVVLVPNAAVQLGQNGPFVYVVKDGKTVEARQIKTGAADAAHTVVASGLEAGESVVIDGVDRLKDGAAVRLA